jgi:ethanolaminephosphotransferase
MIYGGLVLLFSTYTSILNVIQARTSRGENSPEALMGLVPFAVTWTLVPAYLLLFPNVLHHHLIPFIFFCGLTNAYSVGQMIIAHLTKQEFPMYNVLNLPLFIAVVDGAGRATGLWTGVVAQEIEVGYLYGCLGLAIGVYGSFVIDVIVAICDYLDIWCLTIKHPVPIAGNKSGGMATKKAN